MTQTQQTGITGAVNPGLEAVTRPNIFEIDLDAIAQNTRALRRLVGPAIRIFAALKGNAYGYGLLPVARILVGAGIDGISLSNPSDALALRNAGIELPILLYPGVPITETLANVIVEKNLIATILSKSAALLLSSAANEELSVFVKVDVGLERLGLNSADAVELCQVVNSLANLRLGGIYAHMHVPSSPDNTRAYLRWQFDRLLGTIAAVEDLGIKVPLKMVASTAVLQLTGSMNLNAIDPGRFFYGLDPEGPGLAAVELKPALVSVRSTLIQVKAVERREFLDLAPFPVRPSMRLGVIPLGYFDGLDRFSLGEALVRGRRVPFATTPSIEHSRLDLTDVPAAEVGDEVVIIGVQGDAEISPAEVSRMLGSPSPGHLALQIRDSVSRTYRNGGT